MTDLYTGNVIGENLIDVDMPVESDPAPLLVGDEGVIVQYGDRESGVTVSVLAESHEDAERQVIAVWGDDGFIDCLDLIAPVPLKVSQALRNLHHAGRPCDDPDCEIHNPGVVEDALERYTALAWYEAGRRSAAP